MNRFVKSAMLPCAMITGALFSDFFAGMNLITPYLIVVMLFITFCRITPRQMKFSPMLWRLLIIQIAGGVAVYFLARTFDDVLAQGVMICVFAPMAISASVIAGLLGANVATMASFTLISNFAVALAAPVLFSFVGTHSDLPFWHSVWVIFRQIGPLLVFPILGAFGLNKVSPKLHARIKSGQIVSFYLWALALTIVTGRTVKFIRMQQNPDYRFEIILAASAFLVCVLQFLTGRAIGRVYGEKVAAGQSLGQKNTVLAIWMAQAYLSPVASLGPASYVLWQNIVNSYQLWRKRNLDAGV